MPKISLVEKKADKNQTTNRRRHTNTLMVFLSICGATLVVLFTLWNTMGKSLLASNSTIALKIGHESYSAAEFNFYYFGAINELLSKSTGAAGLMGIDPDKSLTYQPCSISDEKISWEEYFTKQAIDAMSKMSAAYSEATKAGFYATDTIKESVDNRIELLVTQSKNEGYYDFETYMAAKYGKGMTERALRSLMIKGFVGKTYTDELKTKYCFTDAEMAEYYEAHTYEYSNYSYLFAFISNAEQESTPNVCQRLAEATTLEEFKSLTLELTGENCNEVQNIKGSELGDRSASDVIWISDLSRVQGDTFIGQSVDGSFVLYFVSNNDNGYADNCGTWKAFAQEGLSNDTFFSWQNDVLSKYNVQVCRGMKYARKLD